MTKMQPNSEMASGEEDVNPSGNVAAGAASRLFSGAIPAAGITFGLFTFMYVAIGGYDAPAEPDVLPLLSEITPKLKGVETEIDGRKSPKPIETSAPPPRLAPYKADKVKVFIPDGDSIGKAPERITRTAFKSLDNIVINRQQEILPITPPNVVYPAILLKRGIEGSCEVYFDVSALGDAYNIRPKCSHSGFERSAKRAVASSRFSPRIENNKPVEQRNVVYPIDFSIDE